MGYGIRYKSFWKSQILRLWFCCWKCLLWVGYLGLDMAIRTQVRPVLGLGTLFQCSGSQVSPVGSRVPLIWQVSGLGSHQRSWVSGPTFRLCPKKHVKQHVYLSKINWNNFQNDFFFENILRIFPGVQRRSVKILFYKKKSMGDLYCIKITDLSPATLLQQDSATGIFLWIIARTSTDSCFCTFSNEFTIFYKI